MKQLIINADDLGLSPAVNDAIFNGAKRNVITAASLMVNMPFAEESVARIKAVCPNLSLALHFCLTSGQAVLPHREIPALVDSNRYFQLGFFGLWRALTSKKTGADVLAQATAEFDAQLERMERLVSQYSLRFDHLDSHQHIHVLPGLLERFMNETKKRQLFPRIPREPFGDKYRMLRRSPSWFPGGLARKAILDYHLRRAEQHIGYFGILDTGQIGLSAFREIVRTLGHNRSGRKIFEMNIHPAVCDADRSKDLRELSHLSQADLVFQRSLLRKRENDLLHCPEFTTLLADNGVALVSFAEVAEEE